VPDQENRLPLLKTNFTRELKERTRRGREGGEVDLKKRREVWGWVQEPLSLY